MVISRKTAVRIQRPGHRSKTALLGQEVGDKICSKLSR